MNLLSEQHLDEILADQMSAAKQVLIEYYDLIYFNKEKTDNGYAANAICTLWKSAYLIKYPEEFDSLKNEKPLDSFDTTLAKKADKLILSIAHNGMPEAIFSYCIKKTGRDILQESYKELVELYGYGKASILNDPFRNSAKKRQQDEETLKKWLAWKKTRKETIFGGFYDENTFARIRNVILPIATRDIWEFLNEYYKDIEQIVPDNDRAQYQILYEYKFPTENKKTDTSKVKKPTTAKIRKKAVASKMPTNEKSRPSDNDLFMFAINLYQNSPSYDLDMISKAKKSLREAAIGEIAQLFSMLDLAKQRFVVVDIIGTDVPGNWIEYLIQYLNEALRTRSESMAFVVGLLDSIGLLKTIETNREFWRPLNSIDFEYLIERMWNGLERKSFYRFSNNCIKSQSENLELISLWKRSLLRIWMRSGENFNEIYSAYRDLSNCFGYTEDQVKYSLPVEIIDNAHSIIAEKNRCIEILQSKEDETKKDLFMQFAGAVKSIERLEIIAARLLTHEVIHPDILANEVVIAISKLRNDLAYIGLKPCESFDSYRMQTEIRFDLERHRMQTGETISAGQKVKLLSLGLLNDDYEIKYKATVCAATNKIGTEDK